MTLRLTLIAMCLASFSSCVTVKTPEHMVSDTIGAGKDLYRAVERKLRKSPKLGEVESNSDGSEFWLADAGTREAPVAELERRCLQTLVSEAKLQVGVDSLEYRVVDQRVETHESNVVVHCQIVVERPRG